MKEIYLILYILALVLFVIAIFIPTPVTGSSTRPRSFSLVAAGLALWVLVDVLRQLDITTT